jgi:hypothetical protein
VKAELKDLLIFEPNFGSKIENECIYSVHIEKSDDSAGARAAAACA